MNSSETLVLYNRLAGSGTAYEKSVQLGRKLHTDRVHEISDLERNSINVVCERVVIVGGDGTIHACVSLLHKKEILPVICIAGGGTGNVLYKMLVHDGASISEEELLDDANWLRRTRVYKPGVLKVHAYTSPIVVAAGFGEFEVNGSDALTSIRNRPIPKDLKIYLSGISALVSVAQRKHHANTPLVRTYSIGEMVGPLPIFSSKELNIGNDVIGRVTISDSNPVVARSKLLLAMMLWKVGMPVPRPVVNIQYGRQFIQETHRQELTNVNLDGDSFSIKTGGDIVVFRDNRNFFATALVSRN